MSRAVSEAFPAMIRARAGLELVLNLGVSLGGQCSSSFISPGFAVVVVVAVLVFWLPKWGIESQVDSAWEDGLCQIAFFSS